jgi:NarL family two-component system response regulator LiaR
MKPYNIVIIDDHEMMRRGLTAALSPRWTIAGEAASLEETRALFEKLKAPPSAVILDIELRDREWGLEILPYLAERYGSANTVPPVLVYSVYSVYVHVKTALGMGVKGYVSKADGLAELETALNAVLQGKIYVTSDMISELTVVSDKISSLTKREKEIFTLVQQGKDNRKIAEDLNLVLRSVENYIGRIMDKLEIKNRRELRDL